MIRNHPAVAATLLGDLAAEHDEVELAASELPECPPTEYRADAVTVLKRNGVVQQAIVVENQLDHKKAKRYSWPSYLTNLRARMRCPTDVLVLCPTDTVAAWCREPIVLGRSGSVMYPVVIGPSDTPAVVNESEALADPELATFSAISHGGQDETGTRVLNTWLTALLTLNDERFRLYFDYATSTMSKVVREHLETLMVTGTYEYKSDFAKKYYGDGVADGEAKGEARSILTVLATRRVEVPDSVRERVMSCTDPAVLNRWLERSVTVSDAEDLFRD